MNAVRRYDILDTPPDDSYERITAIAARLFQVPIALVTIVDTHRIWFKSHHGLGTNEIARSPELCASAILLDGPYIVTDAAVDARTLTNPLVAELGLRFYAAVPLITTDGFCLGSLCVIDKKSHEFSESEIETLQDLAALVMGQLELRLGAIQSTATLEAAKLAAEKASLAKTTFLSNLSHELRSPLTAILGFAQLIESGPPEPSPPQMQSVEQILRAGWHLSTLINEILDLALIESGKLSLTMKPVPLNEVVLECQSMVEMQAQRYNVRVDFPPCETSCVVEADRVRVKQVLINLLSNAIKYNKEDGTVSVTYHEISKKRLRICIKDTGQGLSPEKIEQLFQPFNRLGQESSSTEGTGIGLVVCKQLIELMGGNIGVESEVGVGCVFWFELNLATEITPAIDLHERHPSESTS